MVGNYRGNRGTTTNGGGTTFDHDYNWKDWAYKNDVPLDSDGHGTNVQGILSGSKESGVGVAPGSKWISGKVRGGVAFFALGSCLFVADGCLVV